MGDQIKVGDISGSVAAIGAGAQVIYQNIERALSKIELEEQAEALAQRRLAEALEAHVKRLNAQAASLETQPAYGNPYKALLSYELADAPIFYGRSQAIRSLMSRMERGPLTALYAESGAGKTSLLKAGIMPRLFANGDVPLYVRPYQTPTHVAVQRSLLPQIDQNSQSNDTTLHNFLRRATDLLGGQRLVILLDQFEELFTVQTQAMREAFLNEISPCLDDSLLPVRWVFALRKEWFGDLNTFRPQISDPFANDYPLQTLSDDEAREVIVEPARQYEVSYEGALVEQLIADLGERDISPPQLQLVCSTLFDQHEGSTITSDTYRELGETRGILQGHLERVLRHNVPDDQRRSAQALLEALVTADGKRALRKWADLAAELQMLGIAQATLDQVLPILIDSRLLRVEEIDVEGQAEAAYELAHDYLVDRISLDPDTQARKAAQELLERETLTFGQHGTLLDADTLAIIEARQGELVMSAESEELIERSKRRIVRQRRGVILTVGTIVVLILVAAGVFLTGLTTRNALQADIQGLEAEKAAVSTQVADVEATVAAAARDVEVLEAEQGVAETERMLREGDDLIDAMHEALAAFEAVPEIGISAVSSVLLKPYPTMAITHEDNVHDVMWHTEQNVLYIYTDHDLWAWDMDSGTERFRLTYEGRIGYATLTADSSWIMVVNYTDDVVQMLDSLTGEVKVEVAQPDLYYATLSPDERFIATVVEDDIFLWGASSGNRLRTLRYEEMAIVPQWAPDSTRIAAAGVSGSHRVWDVETGEALFTTINELAIDFGSGEDLGSPASLAMAWSHDGTRLVTSTVDWTLYMWDGFNGERLAHLGPIYGQGSIQSLGWREDDAVLLVYEWEGGFIDFLDGETLEYLPGNAGNQIFGSAWVDFDRGLVIADRVGGGVDYWTADGLIDVAAFYALPSFTHVSLIVDSADGRWFYGDEGNVEVWDDEGNLDHAFSNGAQVTTIVPHPDNPDVLATIDSRNTVRIWTLQFDSPVFAINTYDDVSQKPNLSQFGRPGIAVAQWLDTGRILAGYHGGPLAIFDIDTGESSRFLEGAALSSWFPEYRAGLVQELFSEAAVWSADDGGLVTLEGGVGLATGYVELNDQIIMVPSVDGPVKVWDRETGGLEYQLPIEGNINDSIWLRDGETAGVVTFPYVYLWDMADGEMVLNEPRAGVVAISDNERWLAINTDDEVVDVFDLTSMSHVNTLPIADPDLVLWNSEGQLLARIDNILSLWDVDAGDEIWSREVARFSNDIYLFDQDRRILLRDSTGIQIADVETGENILPLETPAGVSVGSYGLSPSEGLIAVSSSEGWRFYDAATGELLQGHTAVGTIVWWHESETQFMTVRGDSLQIWERETDTLLFEMHFTEDFDFEGWNAGGAFFLTTTEGGDVAVWDASPDYLFEVLKERLDFPQIAN